MRVNNRTFRQAILASGHDPIAVGQAFDRALALAMAGQDDSVHEITLSREGPRSAVAEKVPTGNAGHLRSLAAGARGTCSPHRPASYTNGLPREAVLVSERAAGIEPA